MFDFAILTRSGAARLLFWSLCILLETALPARADSYRTLSSRLAKHCRAIPSPKVVVVPFVYVDKRESPGPLIVSERITTDIASLKGIRVIERSLLQRILEEMKLQMTGVVEEPALMKIGKVLDADVIITGTLIDLARNEVEINARAINISNGLILGVDRGVVEKDWQDPAAPAQRASSGAAGEPKSDISSLKRLGMPHELFQSRCAACHGSDGSGRGAPLSSLGVSHKNLDLTSARVQSKTDEELSAQINQGGDKMPPYGNLPGLDRKIPPEKVAELIRYIRALNRASNALPPHTDEHASLKLGASIYLKSCVYCHGFNGRGLSSVAKTLGVKKSKMDLTAMNLDGMPAEKLAYLLEYGGTKMVPLSHPPSQDEINGLLHYIHALSHDLPQEGTTPLANSP